MAPGPTFTPGAVFDALADRHDAARWAPSPGGLDDHVDALLAQMAAQGTGSVVALGGGSGPELREFAKLGWSCTLVDTSARMLALAARRLGPAVRFVQEDAVRYMTVQPERSAGTILHVGEILGYVEDPEGLVRASARAMSADGNLVQTFVDAARMRGRLGESSVRHFSGGYWFLERRDPPLPMAAFDISLVLGWHATHGLEPIHRRLGPGPRCVVVSRLADQPRRSSHEPGSLPPPPHRRGPM